MVQQWFVHHADQALLLSNRSEAQKLRIVAASHHERGVSMRIFNPGPIRVGFEKNPHSLNLF